MGRACGVSRRRRKNKHPKFSHRSKLQKMKAKLTKQVVVECKAIRDSWDKQKSVKKNFEDMGLVSDPNKSLGVPKAIDEIMHAE